MGFSYTLSKDFASFLLAPLLLLLLISFPVPTHSQNIDLPPSVSELSKNYTEKFCGQVFSGIEPEIAGENAAKELVKGLIFSPILKEIMEVPKEDLAFSISTNIFSQCGDELEITQQELNDSLVKLAKRDREKSEPKPFKPFGIG